MVLIQGQANPYCFLQPTPHFQVTHTHAHTTSYSLVPPYSLPTNPPSGQENPEQNKHGPLFWDTVFYNRKFKFFKNSTLSASAEAASTNRLLHMWLIKLHLQTRLLPISSFPLPSLPPSISFSLQLFSWTPHYLTVQSNNISLLSHPISSLYARLLFSLLCSMNRTTYSGTATDNRQLFNKSHTLWRS